MFEKLFSLVTIVLCFTSCNFSKNSGPVVTSEAKDEQRYSLKNSLNLSEIRLNLCWEKPESWLLNESSTDSTDQNIVKFTLNSETISLVEFPGNGGDLRANLNRWLTQLNLKPIEDSESLDKFIKGVKGKNGIYKLVKISSPSSKNNSLLVAILSLGSRTVFVKYVGIEKHLQENAKEFLAFSESLRPLYE